MQNQACTNISTHKKTPACWGFSCQQVGLEFCALAFFVAIRLIAAAARAGVVLALQVAVEAVAAHCNAAIVNELDVAVDAVVADVGARRFLQLDVAVDGAAGNHYAARAVAVDVAVDFGVADVHAGVVPDDDVAVNVRVVDAATFSRRNDDVAIHILSGKWALAEAIARLRRAGKQDEQKGHEAFVHENLLEKLHNLRALYGAAGADMMSKRYDLFLAVL